MKTIPIHPLQNQIAATVIVPGSLSYTIRALALAAMTKGPVVIENALKSDDTQTMVTILQTLGIRVEETPTTYIVHGGISDVVEQTYQLNVRLSGRTARTIIAMLCIMPGTKTVMCDEAFEKRPIKDLVDALRQLGADITYLKHDGYLPITIRSQKLNPRTVQIKGDVSSQYISALMMIAPIVGGLEIAVIGEQASKPFIDITIDVMKTFGVRVHNKNYQRYTIQNHLTYKLDTFFVASDATAASYFFGIAAITGSTITLQHLNPQSKQGDIHFVAILAQMGCQVEKNETAQWISVTGPKKLQAVTVNMHAMPDVVPTLAVVAAFAEGTTHITGIPHLKIKESDRIEAPKEELFKMGIQAETTADSLTIHGGQPHGAEIETHGDHRIAMSFAMAGTKIEGIAIQHPDVVNKSFPTFWETMKRLGVNIE